MGAHKSVYQPDDAVGLALLEAAIVASGIGHAALVNDLYIASPYPPADLAGAWGRLSSRDLGSFLLAMPFAFFIAWPSAAMAAVLARGLFGSVRGIGLPLAAVPMGALAFWLAAGIGGLTLQRSAILVNGALLGLICGGIAAILIAIHRR